MTTHFGPPADCDRNRTTAPLGDASIIREYRGERTASNYREASSAGSRHCFDTPVGGGPRPTWKAAGARRRRWLLARSCSRPFLSRWAIGNAWKRSSSGHKLGNYCVATAQASRYTRMNKQVTASTSPCYLAREVRLPCTRQNSVFPQRGRNGHAHVGQKPSILQIFDTSCSALSSLGRRIPPLLLKRGTPGAMAANGKLPRVHGYGSPTICTKSRSLARWPVMRRTHAKTSLPPFSLTSRTSFKPNSGFDCLRNPTEHHCVLN